MSQQGDPLARLDPIFRVLSALIDAMIVDDFQEWRVLGAVVTAINRESPERQGITEERHARAMRQWGAVDQDGIYAAAGLTDKERQVTFLRYDRQLQPHEIADLLNREPATVRWQLFRAEEKLRRLGKRDEVQIQT